MKLGNFFIVKDISSQNGADAAVLWCLVIEFLGNPSELLPLA